MLSYFSCIDKYFDYIIWRTFLLNGLQLKTLESEIKNTNKFVIFIAYVQRRRRIVLKNILIFFKISFEFNTPFWIIVGVWLDKIVFKYALKYTHEEIHENIKNCLWWQ